MGWCPLPWPRRAASAAMLEVAAGGGYRVSPCVLRRRLRLCGPIHAARFRRPPPACAGRLALCCLDFPLRTRSGVRSGRPSPRPPEYTPAHLLKPDERDSERYREQRHAHRRLLGTAAATLANFLRQGAHAHQPVRETRKLHCIHLTDQVLRIVRPPNGTKLPRV